MTFQPGPIVTPTPHTAPTHVDCRRGGLVQLQQQLGALHTELVAGPRVLLLLPILAALVARVLHGRVLAACKHKTVGPVGM